MGTIAFLYRLKFTLKAYIRNAIAFCAFCDMAAFAEATEPAKFLSAAGMLMAKVLIVEDDLLISDLIEDALAGSGYEVCGVATTAAEAIALGERDRPDLAIVDVRLADGSDGTIVAARLLSQFPIGVLYATGNVDHLLAMPAVGHACLKKPYRPSDVLRALKTIEQILSGAALPLPLPQGLIMLQGHAVDDGKR